MAGRAGPLTPGRASLLLVAVGPALGASQCGDGEPPDPTPVTLRLDLSTLNGRYLPQSVRVEISAAAGEASIPALSITPSTEVFGAVWTVADDGTLGVPPLAEVFFLQEGSVASRGVLAASDGTFRTDLTPGTYDLLAMTSVADRSTYHGRMETQPLPGTAGAMDLYLDRPAEGTGQVRAWTRDELGNPVEVGAAGLTVEPVTQDGSGGWLSLGPLDTTDATTGYFTLGLNATVEALRISSPDADGPPLPTVLVPLDDPLTALQPDGDGNLPVLFTYPEIDSYVVANQVLDPAPAPTTAGVSGAEVRISGDATFVGVDGTSVPASFQRRVTTDTQGRFALDVPAGAYALDVVPPYVSLMDLSALRMGGTVPIEAPGLGTLLVQLPLRPSFNGVVQAAEGGEPVEGAGVYVRSVGPSAYAWHTRTDADGAFSLTVDTGDVEVLILPPEDSATAPLVAVATAGAGQAPALLELPPPVRVSGQVTYQNGGVGGVGVQVLDPAEGTYLGDGVTDSAGYFEIRISRDWVESR